MDNKLLNIIDRSGNIIGTEIRENVHKKGLLHREVHVLFADLEGRIIFQHRSKDKETCPDLLDATAGGHVEIGSDYMQAALQEIEEETGLKVKESDLCLIKIIESNYHDSDRGVKNNVMRAIFSYKYNGAVENLRQEIGKGIGFESYSLEELRHLSEAGRKRFVPKVIDETYMAIYEDIVKL